MSVKMDKFLSVYGVMHVVVNSRKSKRKELKDWILRDVIPLGVNKLMEEEHQKATDAERHNLAMEKLSKAREDWNRERQQRLDLINKTLNEPVSYTHLTLPTILLV